MSTEYKTISLDPKDLKSTYNILTGTVSPRPIIWIATVNKDGASNLAQFSFCTIANISPMIIDFTVITPRNRRKKDTLRNIEQTKHFTFNTVTKDLADAANKTSAEFPSEENESVYAEVSMIESDLVMPKRVTASPISFECVVYKILSLGTGPGAGTKIFGTVVKVHIKEQFLKEDGTIDAAALDLACRLNGDFWGEISIFKMPNERKPKKR